MKEIKIPEIALVLLVGPSSSGKSTFARKNFLPTEIVSSDACRALVSDDENDLTATNHAFDVLHTIAAARLKMGKLVVIDALNIRKEDRARLVQLAQENYALAVALVLETPIRTLFDRHETRTDRKFGKSVLERQHDDFKRSLVTIKKEKFSTVHFVNPEEELVIHRQKLWNNRKEEHGPFDIIGDIHGCFDELVMLLNKLGYGVVKNPDGHFVVTPPAGRRVIFLGDLTDRGDNSPEVLRLVMDMVKAEQAFCICGNHDEKLLKHLQGKHAPLVHGLEKTVGQLETATAEFRDEVKVFLDGLIAHYVLDDGKLIVAHAGLPEEMHGRASAAVRAFCLYGEVTGEIDAFGLPVRHDWAKNYKGKAMVVYGHTPVPAVEWVNNSINIDTGCVFGGKLSCLRYPTKEIVQVEAKAIYSEPVRPQIVDEVTEPKDEFDDLLDISLIRGKNVIETSLTHSPSKIIIREENAVAAIEVMSRFAIDPKWLIYLPPTMSPPETSQRGDYLEHPEEVFAYYAKNGITEVICQEKHMGSRAIAIICKNPDVAITRFGLAKPALGTVYTRTGRQFFGDKNTETAFLQMLNQALTDSDFWAKHDTDWVCLDGELLPWSAKAKELIIKQYAAVGSAATLGLSASIHALEIAKNRGIATDALLEDLTARQTRIEDYKTAYRNYCRETNGMEGLVYAPFHILATENKTYFDQPHPWHLATIQSFCDQNTTHLMVTANTLVDLQDAQSRENAVNWWVTRTATGGEGMVVKPINFIASHKGRMIQPAMKCRGSEYLRIIYGPEYDTPENIDRLKERSVKVKRDLAIKEFTLGLESLGRFVNRESLGRVHECVFGVLALESEAVDPRL
jgi:protein phosphatase